MNTVLVDDEQHIIESLSILLTEHCSDIKIVGTANSMKAAIQVIKEEQPDVVFLDVSMPFGTGFDLLDALGTINFHVIFATAYEQYAIEAIKRNAFDYLLKPFQVSELLKCTDKLLLKPKAIKDNYRLCIHTVDAIEFVNIRDITYCKSDSSYCHVYTSTKEHYFFSKQFKELESQLPNDLFIRCQNSYIVNKLHVKRFIKHDGGFIELKTGESIPISRMKKEEVIQWLKA